MIISFFNQTMQILSRLPPPLTSSSSSSCLLPVPVPTAHTLPGLSVAYCTIPGPSPSTVYTSGHCPNSTTTSSMLLVATLHIITKTSPPPQRDVVELVVFPTDWDTDHQLYTTLISLSCHHLPKIEYRISANRRRGVYLFRWYGGR